MEFEELKAQINTERMIDSLQKLIETPSVVGYGKEITPMLVDFAISHNLLYTMDRRRTIYLTITGLDPSHTICFGAHLDTIGMVVRSITEEGWLDVRNLGGVNFHSLEGENVTIHTRENGNYTGTVICKSHSVHVFDDARSRERDFAEMAVVLDEDVNSPEEVAELGIEPGDLISVDPRFVRTEAGYIKSRHIDDKACVAALLEAVSVMQEAGLQPACDVMLAFPINEEIGQGGRFVPENVDAYIALDIGLVGGLQHGSEKKVTIGAADRISPYDWDLTTKIRSIAKENQIDAVLDIYYRYASDATAAMNGGANITAATFGMGTMSSHGYERTHIDGIVNTAALALACMLEIDGDALDPQFG